MAKRCIRRVFRPSTHFVIDTILLKAKEISAIQRPAESDWRNVSNWIYQTGPLVKAEQQFIRRKEDLVTLRKGRECVGFDNFVERVLSRTDAAFKFCGWEKNIIKAGLLHYSGIA